jgi:hypothetical protein
MKILEVRSPEDKKFCEFCCDVYDQISLVQEHLEFIKNNLVKDSQNFQQVTTYHLGKKSVDRFGFIKIKIEEGMRNELKFLKRSLELLN